MKNKKISFFMILIFLISCISPVTCSGKDIKRQSSFLQPTVDITYPDDGAEITDQYIVVEGTAYDDMGLNYYQWTWEWSEGSQSGDQEIEPPTEYYEFQIDIGPLVFGENTVTVTFLNTEGASGSDSVTFFYMMDDNTPPEVVITYPEDGAEFDEPDIAVLGYADDHGGSGITKLFWIHRWEDGQHSDAENYDTPLDYITFSIPVTLHEGENTIEVNAMDEAGNSLLDPPDVTVFYMGSEEGFRIQSKFQPVQTIYPDDPLYGDDILSWDECLFDNSLDMIAWKNTYLFGYPYSDRFNIRITACNNYDFDVKCYFVFTIYPDSIEVWRSPLETVPKKSVKTFVYGAPIPDTPFWWNSWSGSDPEKNGYIELTAEGENGEEVTGGIAPCQCESVQQSLDILKTHDIDVLVYPVRFKYGPNYPNIFRTNAGRNQFRDYLDETIEPWWNAIYPLAEGDLNLWYFYNLKQSPKIKLDSGKIVRINSLHDYAQLSVRERLRVLKYFASIGGDASRISGYDRAIFLIHPDILHYNTARGRPLGLAYNRSARRGDYYKYGVFVDWNYQGLEVVFAHEVGHSYYLSDNYVYDKIQNKVTYSGDHSVGYWVNKKRDIPTSSYDFMATKHNIDDTWIKKPNYKSLYVTLSEQEDPVVLSVTGFIDKNNNVELRPWYKLEEGVIDSPWGEAGNYLIKAYDDKGVLLSETGFNVSFELMVDIFGVDELDETVFAFRLEYLTDLHRIDIVKSSNNEVLASRSRTNNPPTISITTPTPGEEIKPGEFEINWDASDLDGDELTYNILVRNLTEDNWYPMVIDHNETFWTANFTDMPKGDYRLKVIVTDDWNTAYDTVDINIKKGKAKTQTKFQSPIVQRILRWFPYLENFLNFLQILCYDNT